MECLTPGKTIFWIEENLTSKGKVLKTVLVLAARGEEYCGEFGVSKELWTNVRKVAVLYNCYDPIDEIGTCYLIMRYRDFIEPQKELNELLYG